MYVYELVLSSRKPEEIASYDTLIYPFDSYIWGFIIGATLVTFMVLLTMQKLWNNIYGKTLTFDHIFKGINTKEITQHFTSLSFSDFFLSTIMIPRKRPYKWFLRPGFMTRKVFLLKWIFVANVFSLGYRSTLLSTLVPIRYEDTIETVHDLYKSGLSLLIP